MLKIDSRYHLVAEAHGMARSLFLQGRASYDELKNSSLHVMDTFMDLVEIMNSQMARTLRGAVIKFYKVKYFHDFTNYIITLEEVSFSYRQLSQVPVFRLLLGCRFSLTLADIPSAIE